MGRRNIIYTAVNVETNEIHKGTRGELGNIVGCSVHTISNHANSGRIYQGYRITASGDIGSVKKDPNDLTEEDLQKWDDFIKSFRKKKKTGFRKPQEVK